MSKFSLLGFLSPNVLNLATLLGTQGIKLSGMVSPNTRKAMTTGRHGHTLTREGWNGRQRRLRRHHRHQNGMQNKGEEAWKISDGSDSCSRGASRLWLELWAKCNSSSGSGPGLKNMLRIFQTWPMPTGSVARRSVTGSVYAPSILVYVETRCFGHGRLLRLLRSTKLPFFISLGYY